MKTLRIDRTGNKYGRLTVESFSHIGNRSQAFWNCICECGSALAVSGGHLGSGHTLSCGCYLADKNRERKTHGEAARRNHSKEYNVWASMRGRCKYKSSKLYHRYGGRGITVCERWDSSFANFLEDMGRCPEGLTLDRLDNDLGYYKDNCAWRTDIEQANNRGDNHHITIDGVTKTLMQWSREVGTCVGTIVDRIRRGKWDEAEAVMTPPRKGNYKRRPPTL